MKLKILVKIVEMFLGSSTSDDNPADMYLPTWLLAFGIVLLAIGTALCILFAASIFTSIGALVFGILCLGGGVLAYLCWKNQKIRILSDEEFEYTTFLGSKRNYYFKDIIGLKQNQDSMTLFVGEGKVHMESCAIISDRLANLINAALEKNNNN